MSADLEKARQAVIEAARNYACNPYINDHLDLIRARRQIRKAVASLDAIERQSRPSDGGRMTESSIGGENV